LFQGRQMSDMTCVTDVVDLLDKLDYCNVDLLRHNLDHHDHSATPNTVMASLYLHQYYDILVGCVSFCLYN